jgi:uncharacterized protein (DUF427 family)
LRREYFIPSDHQSVCPWKGRASYFTIQVGDVVNADAAWCYPSPRPAAEQIRGRVAFWKGIKVVQDSQAASPGLLTRLANRLRG